MNAVMKLEALETYFALMNMNGASRIYRTANDLGVFDAIGTGPRTPAQVADACDLQEKPLKLLMDGLCSIGTLTQDNSGYSPSLVMQFLAGQFLALEVFHHEVVVHLDHLVDDGLVRRGQ